MFSCSGLHRTLNEKCGILINAQKIEQLKNKEEMSKGQYIKYINPINNLVASQKPRLRSNQKHRATNFDLTPSSSSFYAKNVRLKFYNVQYNTSKMRIFKDISETIQNGYYSCFTDGSKSSRILGLRQ